MYTSGSIASLQRLPTEINESGAIAKIRISVESDTVKRLKTFRIISSEMPLSLLILSLQYFICLRIHFFFFFCFHMSLKCFLKSLCPRYIG